MEGTESMKNGTEFHAKSIKIVLGPPRVALSRASLEKAGATFEKSSPMGVPKHDFFCICAPLGGFGVSCWDQSPRKGLPKAVYLT